MLKRYFDFITESKKGSYSNTNLIEEICISMILLNNEFLDNILDQGQKARYSEDSSVFINDLKTLVMNKNRLKLGRFFDEYCEEDEDLSKLKGAFDDIDFNIERDWNKLINSRTTARNIIDKLLGDEKLTSNQIKSIYWLGPNKNEDHQEDIVIETTIGKQYSLFLNKNMQTSKTSSFNTFADEFIGADTQKLYNEENILKWDKLTQEFVRITYENATKPIQAHIEKFIDTKRIDSIGYFEYFNIRHRDPRYKHLGEIMPEFDKNILMFSDLMKYIWKDADILLQNYESAKEAWTEVKIVTLNSRILEHLFTTSLIENKNKEVEKLEDGFKRSSGSLKMKLMKVFVEKLGCLERPVFFVSKKGDDLHRIPSRIFFRTNYDSIDIDFDYHVKFVKSSEDDEKNDFNMRVRMSYNENPLLKFDIIVKFTGGEFSNRLSAKYKFDIPRNFNNMISDIEKGSEV
jgi:hypothetical protein